MVENNTHNIHIKKRTKRFAAMGILVVLFLGVLFGVLLSRKKGDNPAGEGLEDGIYQIPVSLEGGSGKAAVLSPAVFEIQDGKIRVLLEWSSPNYDYMRVGEEKYLSICQGEGSVFLINLSSFEPQKIVADTTAMSVPHEIEYELVPDIEKAEKAEELRESFLEFEREGTEGNYQKIKNLLNVEKSSKRQGEDLEAAEKTEDTVVPRTIPSLKKISSLSLEYARQFAVDYYEGGYVLLEIAQSGTYLVVPEGKEVPEGLDADIIVLSKSLEHIYLAATSAMDLFCSLDAVDKITLSGTDVDGWYIKEAKKAMEDGHMVYAGKYRTPDYERILAGGCDLAIESTMIYHNPEVKEKLETLGIPVLVERSSYESHPLGRMEWIKLYGALLGEEEKAEKCFSNAVSDFQEVEKDGDTGKTAAFFSVNSNGSVSVRKSGDYISKMISLSGGHYIFEDLTSENSLSTMNLQMESFYAQAKEADYLIYNSAIEGEIHTLSDLYEKNELFREFKAVKNGNVWCTGQNMFQESMGIVAMMEDMHTMFTKEDAKDEDMTYLHQVRGE